MKRTLADRDAALGFWRFLLRVHYGLPGIVPPGRVSEQGHFVGGLAGVNTAWPLKASGQTLSPIDAVPVAGFYCFGQFWPQLLKAIGLPNDHSAAIKMLRVEFGDIPEADLVLPVLSEVPS